MGISFDILVVIGRRRRGRVTATCFRIELDNILRPFDSDEMPFACSDGLCILHPDPAATTGRSNYGQRGSLSFEPDTLGRH
jgi:hypothetical protein